MKIKKYLALVLAIVMMITSPITTFGAETNSEIAKTMEDIEETSSLVIENEEVINEEDIIKEEIIGEEETIEEEIIVEEETIEEEIIVKEETIEEEIIAEEETIEEATIEELEIYTESDSVKETVLLEQTEETENLENKSPFKDVEVTRYFYEPILWASENNITTGVQPDLFAPDEPCTRAQVVTFLWRAAGKPKVSNKGQFKDLRAGAYYVDAVNWAVEAGITTGTKPDKFSPDEVCTRGQIVTFLYRATENTVVTTENSFEDLRPNAYYVDAVNWAVEAGITTGTKPNKFSPDEVCTRGQVVTFLYRHSVQQNFTFVKTTTMAQAEFVTDENNDFSLLYTVYIKDNVASADNNYYLMLMEKYGKKIYNVPLTSFEKINDISINVPVLERAQLKEIAMSRLVLAVKQSDGSYKAINEAVVVSNKEKIVKNRAEIFKASSKKGLQGVAYASDGNMPVDARYSNTKQTLLNLDIASVVNPKSNYTNYTYKGTTYKFSNCTDLVANIRSMNAGYEQYLYGNNGTTKVAVSLCLLLSYNPNNSYLIDSAARTKGHKYYTLNVREEKSRETLEALFVYLGELLGQEDCYVTNWILGNEINSSKAWNYSGSLSFDNYMTCYTTAFRMLYDAVKLEKTGNTVSISLDNGWNAVPDTYAGKKVLDSFAKKIHAEDSDIKWSISYHPYSYPLTRADFWNDSSNTTNSTSTKYISMKNITVLTNYAASLEKTYKMNAGSIRILLTEQGYSYGAGERKQAEAIARGYYVAEFNDRIDAFIIRAIVDDAEEIKGKLYFGLMNSKQEKRIAFYVYEFMDSDLSKLKNTAASSVVTSVNYDKFNSAKNILCNTNWKSYVPGFNAAKLAGIK